MFTKGCPRGVFMFTKLKLNKEFRRAYGRGKSFVHSGFVMYVFKTRSQNVRLGITVSKKLGCAVKRNRAKRLITAAFRDLSPNIVCGCDIVFVARTCIFSLKSYDIAAKAEKDLMNAGIIENKNA